MPRPTPRQKVMLAALAAESEASFAPVQVQKMFFLIDENIGEALGGKRFRFQPYDYGPFDKAVYDELEGLQRKGLVQISEVGPGMGRRRYSLTAKGQAAGRAALQELSADAADYMKDVSKWVRKLGFAALVGSIYKAYPHMRANSVFRD